MIFFNFSNSHRSWVVDGPAPARPIPGLSAKMELTVVGTIWPAQLSLGLRVGSGGGFFGLPQGVLGVANWFWRLLITRNGWNMLANYYASSLAALKNLYRFNLYMMIPTWPLPYGGA